MHPPRTSALRLCALATLFLLAACAPPQVGPPPPGAVVVEIVDGDTMIVRSGTHTEPVRLIGIDTPEVAHHGQQAECFGPEAAQRLAELAPVGSTVRLARDTEARDIYDRLLAYVFTADGLLVNLQLAQDGFADALSIAPNLALADIVATSVSEARKAQSGMWQHCDDPVASTG